MLGRGRKKRRGEREIAPDEILIDSSNLPSFDRDRLEGRIAAPISRKALLAAGTLALLIMGVYGVRAAELQLVRGEAFATQARENQLRESLIFADRGVITDRTGEELAYNERLSVTDDFAVRRYAPYRGLAHAIGYAKAPAKDTSGFYYRDAFVGIDGVERVYDAQLAGKNGLTLTETDARGALVSEAQVAVAHPGERLVLSIDAAVNEALYSAIADIAGRSGFRGGAGVIMDVETGELLALTSFPEYSPTALLMGDKDAIAALNEDSRQPFLNRAVQGLYAPGSIVKPLVAAAALEEGVITEEKQILSTGSISVPNPYDPSRPTVFRDWRAHGWVDMRHATAVSSDVYFYEVGGGFQGQQGLGIANLDKYFKFFGFGEITGIPGFTEKAGNIPTPEWKAETFPEDPTWRVGNTYHTAIGQYGMTVTPLQAARMSAALASGKLVVPTLIASTTGETRDILLSPRSLAVAREGMRLSVTQGIAAAVNLPSVPVAAKTGTAEVGVRNEYMNSWMIGFWPYEKPRYAYAVVLERAPAGTLVGASAATAQFLQWMQLYAPEYLD